jgi:hypothetical protein
MVFEHQAEWIRDIELGAVKLPSEAQMHEAIARKDNWVKKYYKHSDRHTIEEEHVLYLKELKSSLRAMRRAA